MLAVSPGWPGYRESLRPGEAEVFTMSEKLRPQMGDRVLVEGTFSRFEMLGNIELCYVAFNAEFRPLRHAGILMAPSSIKKILTTTEER